MKITGTSTLAAPPQQVWDAVHDPAVLARCLPGCERLTELGHDHYAMTVTAGVAAIKGTYDGEVALLEPLPPSSFAMRASGVGAPGTVDALVVVRLAETPAGGTELTYDADASVGGAIGGVGQRMLSGVTRKMAGQFFAALDADIAGAQAPGPAEAPARRRRPPPSAGAPGGPAGRRAAPTPRSFAGRAPGTGRGLALEGPRGFAARGRSPGALVALLGVALGARLGRRR